MVSLSAASGLRECGAPALASAPEAPFKVGQCVRVHFVDAHSGLSERRRGTVSFLNAEDKTLDIFLLEPLPDKRDELCDIHFHDVSPLLPFEEVRHAVERIQSEPRAEASSSSGGKCRNETRDAIRRKEKNFEVWQCTQRAEQKSLNGSCSSSHVLEKRRDLALGAACSIKDQGNELFKLQDFEAAREHYSVAIDALLHEEESGVPKAEWLLVPSRAHEEKSFSWSSQLELRQRSDFGTAMKGIPAHDRTTQGVLYLNRARCLEKLGLFAEAAQDATVVIALHEGILGLAKERAAQRGAEMTGSRLEPSVTHPGAVDKVSKALFLRAKTKMARKKYDHALRDVDGGLEIALGGQLQEFRKLQREIQIARKAFVQGNKSLAKEMARWADQSLDQMGGQQGEEVGN
ncbi:unnamed protein product [Amoebophrya sp. A25]|nr:unnamed protein product [Amoebophrya sp. A25]|eukprot:GSA25T00000653001.1